MKTKLLNSMRVLLIAAGLCVGASAWADQTKVSLWSADFETGVAGDYWKNGSDYILASGRHDGTVAGVKSSSDRGAFMPTTCDWTDVDDYTIELDFYPCTNSRSHDFAVVGESSFDSWTWNYGFFWKTSSAQEHNSFLFYLNLTSNNTFVINKDYGSDGGDAVALTNAKWHHLTLNITRSTGVVAYNIVQEDDNTKTFSGSYTMPDGESCNIRGLYVRNSRYNYNEGSVGIDNVEVYHMVEGMVAQKPTVTLTRVNNDDRIYSISFVEGETLHYTKPGDATEYTSTTSPTEVTVSTDGDLTAWTTVGGSTSGEVVTSVTTGAITLPTPTYTITGLGAGYSKTFTITAANNVLLTPTVSLSYVFTPEGGAAQSPVNMAGNTISATEAGTYVVTSSAAGYTSASVTIENTTAYKLVKTIDFTALTASDFSELWTSATGGLRDYWTSRAAGIPANATYYSLVDPSAATATTSLSDVTFVNPGVRQPQVYIGYGLYTPYDAVSGSGNNLNLTINDATTEQLAVYQGWNNYGSGTFTTVQVGNANFGLYRYDTMLKTIKLYAPITEEFDVVTVSNAGYATYVNNDYDLDFTASEIKAYTAKVSKVNNNSICTLTEVEQVPAGTPVLLYKEGGATENIPVMTGAAAVGENDLRAGTTTTATEGLATTDGEYTNMILNVVDDQVGFYFANGKKVATNRAYLHILTSLAPAEETNARMTMVFADDATAIQLVRDSEAKAKGYYNLNGQRVAQPAKGLYIVNGKKVIIK